MDMYRSSDSDSSERIVSRPRPGSRRKAKAGGVGQAQAQAQAQAARDERAEVPRRRSAIIDESVQGLTTSQSESTSASVSAGPVRRTGPKRQLAPPVGGACNGLAIAIADNKDWVTKAQVNRHIEVLVDGKHARSKHV